MNSRRIAALPILAGLAQTAIAQCPPAEPTGVHATQGTHCGSIVVTWNEVSGANRYSIYRGPDGNYANSEYVGFSLFGDPQFTDITASSGTRYYYWIRATRNLCPPWNNTSYPWTQVPGEGWRHGDPLAPMSVEASDSTHCGGVRVSWMQVSPLGAYPTVFRIYRNTVNLYLTSTDVGHLNVAPVGGGYYSFIDASATPGTVYYYWVRAENECGTAASDGDAGSTYTAVAPANNSCANAIAVANGSYAGTTACASSDGSANCGTSAGSPDVWYRYTAPAAGMLVVETCGSTGSYDTVLSLHSGCPGTTANQLACNDDTCDQLSRVNVFVTAGQTCLIRVAGFNSDSGGFVLNVAGPAQPCYANCDSSTSLPILNVNDFNCFLNRFAAGDSRANCDGSTTPPVLNINDFTCFLNRFAAGCS